MTVDTLPPPDDWSPEAWRQMAPGLDIPAETHELNQRHLEFIAWLVATGRLVGDTPAWPAWRPYHDLGIW